MGEKKKLKLWLPEEKLDRVTQVASDYGYKNANSVMETLIDSYLDFFIEAEKARQAEINRQRQALFGVKPAEKRKAG